jgi:hypothetical protein
LVLFLELWELLDKDVLQPVVWSFMKVFDKVKDAVVAAYKQLSMGIRWKKQSRWTANRYWRSRNVQ